MRLTHSLFIYWIVAGLILAFSACTSAGQPQESPSLVIYSGRSESLVGPLIEQFRRDTGIQVDVRWGETAQLAATLLEEGQNSPADVFFAQEPGGLGAVIGLLAPLPEEVLAAVDPRFRDPEGRWLGVSGRGRVVVYNTQRLDSSDLPPDLWGFTEPEWRGRMGWAPTNGSFQIMVTAMRTLWGEAETRRWLEGMLANQPVVYENNTSIVAAAGAGEVDVGFVNHYYLYRFLAEEGEDFPARNHVLPSGGPGSLVMVAGIGRLATGNNPEQALEFIRYLTSTSAQEYFAGQTYEYPLVAGVPAPVDLVPLSDLPAPPVALADLADLQGTLALLREIGVLP